MAESAKSDSKIKQNISHPRFWKFCFILFLCALALPLSPQTHSTVINTLADAYIQVSTFVAATLLLFYLLERKAGFDLSAILKKHEKWQVPIAALMGALPGCGGAIIVITHYVTGRLSFGAMVAVLTATMGDAAFLLIAKEPSTALKVIVISITAGIITGLLADRIHGRDFMAPSKLKPDEIIDLPDTNKLNYHRAITMIWYLCLLPGLGLGIAYAIQYDFGTSALSQIIPYFGAFCALLSLSLWALLDEKGSTMINMLAHPACREHTDLTHRTMFETSFVTAWVVMAFLVFELGTLWLQIDLEAVFKTHAILVPLIAALVGFIPGCGPQIIVTTLYLAGIVPFAAQIANAISNDGDALFPAIAMAPRTAILATIYTGIPALLIGYGFYFYG
ncbi:MAG TPA: hypothetical protein EYQ41_06185 [Micavibrio sp.]|nr:hypothetical protein [Micavibrio sp.]